jgi:hypothetical protein
MKENLALFEKLLLARSLLVVGATFLKLVKLQ